MSVDCEVWLDEKKEVGRYVFAQLPRAGDTVSLPDDSGESKGKAYRHFRVDSVTHRAADETLKAVTYLFISKGA